MQRAMILMMVLPLANCVSPIETRVHNTGENGPIGTSFVWGIEPRTEDGIFAKQSVAGLLSGQGLKQAEPATLRLDVTFSALPASLTIATGEAVAIGKARPPRQSKKCEPMEYRLGVAFTTISNGATAYKSSAAEYHCMGNARAIIPALAELALRDMGKPAGAYSVERKKIR
jgi:hypothetical protein